MPERGRAKSKKWLVSGSISLLLHGLIIALLLRNPPQTHESASVVEMTVIENQSRPNSGRAENETAQVNRASRASRPKKLDLLPKLSFGKTAADRRQGEAGFADGTQADDPTVAWGDGGKDFRRIEDLGLMTRIFEATNESLYYPSVLANHNVQGTVNARLVLAEDGNCDWKRTNISSLDRHLQVFVLSVLKNVCHRNFKRYLRRKSANVDFSFAFEITEHDDKQIVDSRNKLVGNVLMFYRNSQHSVAEWHLGPFQGMFPIPFVSLDFNWLAENWDKVVNGRSASPRDF